MIIVIINGNKTEWSPVCFAIIQVINKIGRPVKQESNFLIMGRYDYIQNSWKTQSPVTN